MNKNIKKAPAEIRRDTKENWEKAIRFIPQVGSIIIYDFEDGSIGLKLGDGKTPVNNLAFLHDLTSNTQGVSLKSNVSGDVLEFTY